MKQKLMIIAALVVCALTLNGCLLYSLSKSCVVSVKVYDVYGEDEYPFVFATFKGEEENGRTYVLARRNQRHSIVIRQTW